MPNPIVTITNDTGEGGDTSWQMVDAEITNCLPPELIEPLRQLNMSMQGLRSLMGATSANIVLSVLTLSAWASLRAFLVVPEFIRWVESGLEGSFSRKAFTPIQWPSRWTVQLEVTGGHTMGLLEDPRFTLTLKEFEHAEFGYAAMDEGQGLAAPPRPSPAAALEGDREVEYWSTSVSSLAPRVQPPQAAIALPARHQSSFAVRQQTCDGRRSVERSTLPLGSVVGSDI